MFDSLNKFKIDKNYKLLFDTQSRILYATRENSLGREFLLNKKGITDKKSFFDCVKNFIACFDLNIKFKKDIDNIIEILLDESS